MAFPTSKGKFGPGPARMLLLLIGSLALSCTPEPTSGNQAYVAVASNFRGAMDEIAERFETATGRRIVLAYGSTGKHYAQIINGAPFDVFFAADAERPMLLEKEGIARSGSRYTYAIGHVALWSPDPELIDSVGSALQRGNFDHIAIANPALAPYGLAAKEILTGLQLWDSLESKIVRGENINQVFHYVRSRNAQLGFIAYSHLKQQDRLDEGSIWVPAQSLYTPIEQQLVLLTENEAAVELIEFVKGTEARQIIQQSGYRMP